MSSYGRPSECDIINVFGTYVVVTNTGMFSFDIREYDEQNEKVFKFISEIKKENPTISSESMYQIVDTYIQDNQITGITFDFISFLDYHFYGKGGGLNMGAYGRLSEGDIIKISDSDWIVSSVGMFTFDIIEYEKK